MSRYFLELSYCGTKYNGWQIQANTSHTIQQILTDVLSTTLRHPITLTGCGRTDAGVHAKQFFAHFDSLTLSDHPFEFWLYKWNSMLPADIAVHQLYRVTPNANARYDAIMRTYEYHIHQKKDPFLYQRSWYYTQKLNNMIIQEGIQKIKQQTDFACFTKDASEYNHTQCMIYDIQWNVKGHRIVFVITANRFLRNMVRAIVGTLIWLGLGKYTLNDLENILLSGDRKKAGFSAPAEGLYLTQIKYPESIFIV